MMRDMSIICECPICGAVREVRVNSDDYAEWQAGKLIQDAFPYLSMAEREALITGFCVPCWNAMFGEEEED